MENANVLPNTDEWLAERIKHKCASEAPIVMGCSPFVKREELLKYKKTGVSKIIDNYLQKIFDDGHAYEAQRREIVEMEFGESVAPFVGVTVIDGMKLLASFDGLAELWDFAWEHKSYNKTLHDNIRHNVIEDHHAYQLEHQMIVAGDGCKHIVFDCSQGTDDPATSATMVYVSDPEKREALIAAWKQFDIDLESYEVTANEEVPEAIKHAALPAVKIELTGKILASNLDAFKEKALYFIDNINTDLVTNLDFEQAEEDIKACQKAEDSLEAALDAALKNTEEVSNLMDTVKEVKEKLRAKRLSNTKLVKDRKAARKVELVTAAENEIMKFIRVRSEDLRGNQILGDMPNFHELAVKGKSNFDRMEMDIKQVVADEKIVIIAKADLILSNLKMFDKKAEGYEFLFQDLDKLIHLEEEFLSLKILERITIHKDNEALKEKNEKIQVLITAISNSHIDIQYGENETFVDALKRNINEIRGKVINEQEFGDFVNEATQARETTAAKMEGMLAEEEKKILAVEAEINSDHPEEEENSGVAEAEKELEEIQEEVVEAKQDNELLDPAQMATTKNDTVSPLIEYLHKLKKFGADMPGVTQSEVNIATGLKNRINQMVDEYLKKLGQ